MIVLISVIKNKTNDEIAQRSGNETPGVNMGFSSLNNWRSFKFDSSLPVYFYTFDMCFGLLPQGIFIG